MTRPSTTAPATIERTLDLAAPPDRVWHALADPAEVATWFADAADLPPEGRDGFMAWDEHGRFAVRVEAFDPPRYLAWRGARDPDTAIDEGVTTLVEWWLEPTAGGGTRLRLRESGFEREEDRRDNVVGWRGAFVKLADHLAIEPWQRGIVRTYTLRSSPERVWRAFADPAQLGAWWAGTPAIEVRDGYEGWWVWPESGGRYAMRFDHVEPPTCLVWRWVTVPEVPLPEAGQVLRTEWVFVARDDGGTDLLLFESGFTGPGDHTDNESGWDGEVVPGLRQHLGE